MSKNLQSPTKLTEFAPLQPEEKPQSVGQFISKFFKISKSTAAEEQSSTNTDGLSQEGLPSWAVDSSSESSFPSKDSSSVYEVEVNEGRNLPNVLKRITNLLALKSNNLQEYADTELKQYWMPDSVSKECYECSEKFTTFRRRHHCRVCGQIFCSQCCNQQIPGKIFGCTGDLRVCTYCCKVVLSYLQSSDLGTDLSTDLKLLQENLQTKFGDSLSPNNLQISPHLKLSVSDTNTLKRKISVGYQEEKFASGSSSTYLTSEEKCRALQNSMSLRNLFEEICKPTSGITFDTHRHRYGLRTYTECFLGSELVDWLIFQQKAKTRVQAAAICQALLEGNYIENINEPRTFVDGYALYKKGIVISPSLPQPSPTFEAPLQEEPSWVQQIPQESNTTDSDNEHMSPMSMMPGQLTSSSSYALDLNIEANTVYLSRPPESPYTLQSPTVDRECHGTAEETTVVRPSEQRELVPESGWFNAKDLREDNQEREAYNCLTETYEHHEQCLAKQLLSLKGLSHSWWDIIIPLVHDIVTIVRPDKNQDAVDLDIRHYVQFKKLSAGEKKDTKFVGGIVCSKNVAHKEMSVDIENPKILLLQCSIVYQRTEGRLMSLEPVLMQEHEYLRHVAARIVALQPDIVLVQRNVSRLAQDMLRQQGITLVHNLKQNVLERISRCTDADIVNAVDAHIGKPKLGTCRRFYLKTFNIDRAGQKTLMFFEGLPFPHLGGTVLLRGGSRNELSRLKNVASFLLYSTYNWRLEKSFLMDEFALPPNSRCEFLDDSHENSPDRPKPKVSIEEIVKPQENIINEAKKIAVDDFTDPLHSYNTDEHNSSKEFERIIVAKLPFSNNFRKLLDDTILCVSPYIVLAIPYLETDQGRKCKLRSFFPKEIYFSEQFSTPQKSKFKEEEDNLVEDDNVLGPIHPFVTMKITSKVDSPEIQNQLALFRACGGRYPKRDLICKVSEEPKEEKVEQVNNKDVFDPNNHQRLAVLFCSFSYESNNAPAFCVNPWVVIMDFYGRNDIPLGCFLERYCFRPTYMCPSKTCDTPMFKHIRRFVHNSGCVSISLKHFENEFAEENIVMWTWCTQCQSVSPVVPMSTDTWSYSFAKYLELKFHGDVFRRRGQAPCRHSLHHDHYQYFGYKNYVASFKYTSINIWEVSLPNLMIEYSYDMTRWQNLLIDDIRLMAQKGHEVFSLIQDKLLCLPTEELEGLGNLKQLLLKEQSHFKQNIEDVQLKLTSPTIENKQFDEKGIHMAYWRISDTLVRIKRTIVEAVDNWNLRLSEAAKKRDGEKKKDKSLSTENENSTTEVVELLNSAEGEEKDNSSLMNRKMKSLDHSDVETSGHSSPKSHHRSQSEALILSQNEEVENKKDSEKKTVKTILDKLKPSPAALTSILTPFNNQEHYTLPTGVTVPIIVYESEPSSIVAYALNSFDYKRAFDELTSKKPTSEQSPSPLSKRKSQAEKDKSDNENTGIVGFLRSRGSRTDLNSPTYMAPNFESPSTEQQEKSEDQKKARNSHIEIQFQDSNCNFFCRIYLAEKFAALRSAVLPLGEEAYIRSLSRSVEWKAKGGKSGSNFSKTADDRFVLKDLSKNEIQLFLESASNYFTYMQKCVATKQPTLLGKIVGIYQIIFKNNSNVTLRSNFLVMENLFYNRDVTQKFDLKGSIRNRLVVPDNQEGEIVLLDENLLKMTCDSPLYILPHSKAVLTAAIQNDTEFLSGQSVMDYSLLVGLDSKNNELVLGIIDYIRTFTWDKRFEAMVKKSGILGGQGKLPTIIRPEEYEKRFIEAMHRYFLEVPDHWAGLGKGIEI